MKIPLWIAKAAAHPLAHQASKRVAGEIATHGLIGLIDKALDNAALQVAIRIHEKELQNKGETDESV